MSEMPDKISIVICAYTEERWKELQAAVASARAQTVRPCEIILVIDHNPQLLARTYHEISDVKIIENRQARGLSGARNSGIAVAQGEIIAFMDEDATAAPDWLAQLMQHYRDPHVWGVGGQINPRWSEGRPRWFPTEFNWVVGCTYRGLPDSPKQVRNLIGCNMSFRHEAFQKVGGFRSGVGRVGSRPTGCEETELCIRLQQQQPQIQLMYEPQSQVFHSIPKARTQWRYFVTRCYAEGLSKALIARYVGTEASITTERTYALHTLPWGIWHGLGDALRRNDPSGISRAFAIVIGLIVTTIGYVYGRLALRLTGVQATNGSVNLSSEHL